MIIIISGNFKRITTREAAAQGIAVAVLQQVKYYYYLELQGGGVIKKDKKEPEDVR